MEQLVRTVADTFDRSSLDDLQTYFSKCSDAKNFILASDYCIADQTKKHDVISFILFPCIQNFFHYQQAIREVMPRDLKKTKTINPKVEQIIASGTVFCINFILPRGERRIFHNMPKKRVTAAIDATISMIDVWINNEPENATTQKAYRSKVVQLRQEHLKKNFNLNLFADILIVSTLAAFITHKILKHSSALEVIWFSDRDNMTTYQAGIIYDFYMMHHNGISRNDKGYNKVAKLAIGTSQSSQKCWYDEIIRLADFFAGSYADYDYKNNLVTADKFNSMIEFSSHNVSNIILEQAATDNSSRAFQASRLSVKRTMED